LIPYPPPSLKKALFFHYIPPADAVVPEFTLSFADINHIFTPKPGWGRNKS
jgi:hypothetical protein